MKRHVNWKDPHNNKINNLNWATFIVIVVMTWCGVGYAAVMTSDTAIICTWPFLVIGLDFFMIKFIYPLIGLVYHYDQDSSNFYEKPKRKMMPPPDYDDDDYFNEYGDPIP